MVRNGVGDLMQAVTTAQPATAGNDSRNGANNQTSNKHQQADKHHTSPSFTHLLLKSVTSSSVVSLTSSALDALESSLIVCCYFCFFLLYQPRWWCPKDGFVGCGVVRDGWDVVEALVQGRLGNFLFTSGTIEYVHKTRHPSRANHTHYTKRH